MTAIPANATSAADQARGAEALRGLAPTANRKRQERDQGQDLSGRSAGGTRTSAQWMQPKAPAKPSAPVERRCPRAPVPAASGVRVRPAIDEQHGCRDRRSGGWRSTAGASSSIRDADRDGVDAAEQDHPRAKRRGRR